MPNNELKAAGIGAAGGVAGGLINGIFSQIAAKQEYNRQLDFWDKQNRYNSPQAQRDRLNAAGFNPSAAMEQVAGSNTAGELSSVPGNVVAKNGILDPRAISDWFHAFADLENTVAGTQHLTAQVGTELTKQMINNLEAAGIKIDNKTKELMYEYADDEMKARIDKLVAEAEGARAGANLATEQATTESETRELKKEHIKADTGVKKSQAANLDSSTALLEKQISWYDANQAAGLELVRAQVAKLSAETQREIIGAGNDALLFERQDFLSSASDVFGFDISNLPPATKTQALSIYKGILTGNMSLQEGTQALLRQLKAAREHETSVLESWGTSYNFMGAGYSQSFTTNTNK